MNSFVTLIQETQRGEDGYPKYRSAHINVEITSSIKSIKYVCKYVTKGSDHAAFGLGKTDDTDEIKIYESDRYISSSEAAWKTLANNVAERIENPPTTTLQAFFQICQTDNFARTLLYSQVASYYVWKNKNFVRCKQGQNVEGWPGVKKDTALSRVYTIHPNNVECYHLRLLLHYVKGPTSYSFLKTVNNIEYPTFQATYKALGLLKDDNQWDFALEEAALCRSPNKMRELFSEIVLQNEPSLIEEQWFVYKQTLNSIKLNLGKCIFLDAPGGTGKTHLINILLAKVRSSYGIVIAAASLGIAATLLHGGKTAFKWPLNLNTIEIPTCNINKQSNMAKVLKKCKLIVWDASPTSHKKGFEALNNCLKDLRNSNLLMRGVTVLLAGDFRQTTNQCEEKITLLTGLGTVVNTLQEFTYKIYPGIENLKEISMDWLCERAILTSKNETAKEINKILLGSFQAKKMEYRSVNSVLEIDDAVNYPVEFLNSLNPPGFPPHLLTLKIGSPIMLLRNLSLPKLYNGTRLRITDIQKNLIEAQIMTGSAKGESVFILRIPMIPLDYSFQFKRMQFPVKVCFAMTINKSQGQTLKIAGIDVRDMDNFMWHAPESVCPQI
ncbi:hypothetical protein QTP88_005655 [Uroleucon formosanum]